MTAKTGKYDGDQLFHAIYCDNDPTTIHFMYFPHHEVESTQVLNGLPCIISEELLIKPAYFVTRSGIDRVNMGIWDNNKRTFTKLNELHNEEATEGMFECTGLTELNIYWYPQSLLKKKWETLMRHIFINLTHGHRLNMMKQ